MGELKRWLAVLVGGASLVGATSTAATPPELPKPDSHGITLLDWEQVDRGETNAVPRLIDATLTSEAIYAPGRSGDEPRIDEMAVPINVRILLPANYRAYRDEGYPVLYLLHGGGGGYTDWTDGGDIESIISESDFDGIVVMPEGGWAGWYSNWAGETDGHFRPLWEKFHIGQLLPWIDANFNTIRGRKGRAIAGLSMGGLGALMYAGRFTDKFSAVGSFSGGTTFTEPAGQAIVASSMGTIGASVREHGPGDPDFLVSGDTDTRIRTVFGNPGQTGQWDRKNPVRMAPKYERYDGQMALYSGTTGSDAFIGVMNAAFHDELVDEGVEHRFCTGPGEHYWIWWKEDLADFLDYVYGDTPTSCPNDWGAPIE